MYGTYQTGRLLQEIINTDGVERFLEIEEECILSLNKCHAVISTGGSVVLRSRAMKHLTSDGMIIYLEISYDEMVKRLKNITTRGIVLEPGQSLRDMYDQRIPLYERYADIRINCSGEAFESVVENVVLKIREHTAVLAEHS